mmetsp:Transcript_37539/g.83582  ORF Transcript_37539/g.83582 Transcript_37539/m.83582 type:complete len:242 (+) Transcript_37539:730-1455(+)
MKPMGPFAALPSAGPAAAPFSADEPAPPLLPTLPDGTSCPPFEAEDDGDDDEDPCTLDETPDAPTTLFDDRGSGTLLTGIATAVLDALPPELPLDVAVAAAGPSCAFAPLLLLPLPPLLPPPLLPPPLLLLLLLLLLVDLDVLVLLLLLPLTGTASAVMVVRDSASKRAWLTVCCACAMPAAARPASMGLNALMARLISGSMSTTVRGVASLASFRSTQSTNESSRSCLMAMKASRLAASR